MGVHDIFWSKATATDLFDLIPAVGVPTVIAMGANYLFNIFPLGVILLAGLFSFVGFTISRYRSRLFSGLAWRLMRLRNGLAVARERVLIIGGGRSGQLVSWLLKDYLKADALHMVGFVDDDLYKQGVRVNGIRVIGQNKDIPELVEKYDVGLIIFAIHNIPSDQQQRLINTCRNTPARVKKCPDFLETLTQIVAFDDSLKNGNHQSASI